MRKYWMKEISGDKVYFTQFEIRIISNKPAIDNLDITTEFKETYNAEENKIDDIIALAEKKMEEVYTRLMKSDINFEMVLLTINIPQWTPKGDPMFRIKQDIGLHAIKKGSENPDFTFKVTGTQEEYLYNEVKKAQEGGE